MTDRFPILFKDKSTSFLSLIWVLIFCVYGGGAFIWWLLQPRGFPINHPRFWANNIIPLVISLVGCIGIGVTLTKRISGTRAVIIFFLGATCSAITSAFILFPQTLGFGNGAKFLFLLFLGCAVVFVLFVLAIWYFIQHRQTRLSLMPLLLGAVASLFVGSGWTMAQRGMPPATSPLNMAVPESLRNLPAPDFSVPDSLQVGDALVWPMHGLIQVSCGELEIEIAPLLTFTDRSPDGFWTLFSSERGVRRQLSGFEFDNDEASFGYQGSESSWMQVKGGDVLTIDAYAALSEPIYSHLNSFSRMSIYGGQRLAISFGDQAEAPVELMEAGYPFGAPARMGYMDQANGFYVVEADNAEKGPFQTLAHADLARDDALRMRLYNGGVPQCEVVLEDWAAQASGQLSPTAGWGLPENSIEFRLVDRYDLSGFIYISLASTSVGRGFDSVGHSAGVYRNRIRVESIELVEN